MGQGKTKWFFLALPFVFGALSLVCFMLYFYSANHAPSRFIGAILVGPILSLAGMITAILTRKVRKECPALWLAGLISCLPGLALCVGVIAIMFLFAYGVEKSGF